MAYSKSRVDRAGRLIADQMQLAMGGNQQPGAQSHEIAEAIEVLEWWRGEHAKALSTVAANLRYYAGDEGKPVVAQRLKRAPTIADKLVRESGMKLSRMEDIGGVRAILPDQIAAYQVASRLRKNWTITRFRNYVAEPKPDGYRALHLINRNRGRLIEVQLRTPNQDVWANAVERIARRFPGLKSGGGPPALSEYFQAAAQVFAIDDQDLGIDRSFLLWVRELQDRADTFVDELLDES